MRCLLFPLAGTAAPLAVLAILADEAAERAMIAGWFALSAASFCWGHRLEGRWRAALIVVAIAVLLMAVRPASGDAWQALAAMLGGIGLAAGQWLNRRLCRSCRDCAEEGGAR